MNFQLQRRILILGTIFTLIVTSGVFTYFIYSQNESARIQMVEDKLKGDANSILAHLYSSGNWAWFDDALKQYQKLGITCLNVKDKNGKTVWGDSGSCSKNIVGRNYIDQKILDIGYDLPETTILSTVKTNGLSFGVFFITMLCFLSLAYWLLKRISLAHTEALVKMQNLKSLNESNENLLQVTKTLAHNLRSPLAAIKTFNELAENKLNEDEKKILVATHESISQMVSKLIEQDTMKVETAPMSLTIILNRVVGMKHIEYRKLDFIEIKQEIGHDLYSIVNESEFMSIISNLVNNSIEARKEDAPAKIMITANQEAQGVIIKVKDNGIGINRDNVQRAFTYGRSTKKNGKGCGLYHAKKLIESWNGEIRIASVEGQFTEVTIKLPIYKRPKEIILIDNENLNIYNWQGMAKKKHIPFNGFNSSADFFANAPVSKDDVAIYVDYDLDNENGLDVVKKLRDAGFSNVALATGEDEQIHPHVRQVGKEFPKYI